MKVILRQDIEKLGDRGDVKEVKAGYARNFLIPRALAVVASKSNLKALEEQKRVDERKEARIEVTLKERADSIADTAVEITARAGAEGRIYGSVTAAQISAALREKFGLEIDKRRVLLESPIKNIGEHTVYMRLSAGQEVPVRVNVVPEEGEAADRPDEKAEAAPQPEAAEEPKVAEAAFETAPADETETTEEPDSEGDKE
ncbi:MAG: 50S ribosomal protein L9 [bacterium]